MLPNTAADIITTIKYMLSFHHNMNSFPHILTEYEGNVQYGEVYAAKQFRSAKGVEIDSFRKSGLEILADSRL